MISTVRILCDGDKDCSDKDCNDSSLFLLVVNLRLDIKDIKQKNVFFEVKDSFDEKSSESALL